MTTQCDDFRAAIVDGDVNTVKSYLDNGYTRTTYDSMCAAKHGQIAILELLRCDRTSDSIVEEAVNAGQLDTLKWLASKKFTISSTVINRAVYHGYLNIVEWYIESGYEVHDDILYFSVLYDRVEVMKYLIAKRYTPSHNLLSAAARSGNLDTLKWLRENRNTLPGDKRHYRWDDETCVCAILGGNTELLKWSIDNGARVTMRAHKSAELQASVSGKNDMVLVLRERYVK